MSSNNETNNSLDSLKGLRNGTYVKLNEFTKTIDSTKRQIFELSRRINERSLKLKSKEDEDRERIENAEVSKSGEAESSIVLTKPDFVAPETAVTNEPEASEAPVKVKAKKDEKAETAPPEPSEDSVDVAQAAVAKPVEKDKKRDDKRIKPKETKAVEPKREATPQPKREVKVEKVEDKKRQSSVEKAENNRKVAELAASTGQKTYMDDSGNLKVRRFLDLEGLKTRQRAQNEPPQQRGAERRPFDPNRPRPPFPPRDSRPRPAGEGGKDGVGTYERRPFVKKTFTSAPPPSFPGKNAKTYGNKNKTSEKPDEKKTESRRNLLIRNFDDFDDDRAVHRRARPKKQEIKFEQIIKKIDRAVINHEEVQIKTLSEKTGISVSEIIKKLLLEGIKKTANDKVEFAYAEYIAGQFGVELIQKLEKTAEEVMIEGMNVGAGIEELPDDTKRAPIVTVMGHVDHGKTSLLDAIKKTNVAEGEAGGITQHIGAYQVFINREPITFIDTPGHEAFTAMRARGAQVTDIAIIVVAADDGVMPQTVEAINHAKAAEVPIIVAINKMDKPAANPDNVKTQLSEHGLISEEWGGDTIMVPVSAKTGKGLDVLLESIIIIAEVKELKANHNKRASGTVIEAKLDKGKGPVATILVQNGVLNVGDNIVAGTIVGKVRAMIDNTGKNTKRAGPSCPVEVLGFDEVPKAGDFVYSVEEKLAKQVASERKDKEKELRVSSSSNVSLDDLYGRISEGNIKVLNLIVKCDVQGSLEALKLSLSKISNDEVKIVPIHGGVGGITETDVMLARASNAIIIGFNVRADNNAKATAEKNGVDIRLYRIIYDAVDDITSAMKGMLAPKYQESIVGSAVVREVFKITGIGTVAGCYVTNGKILRSAKVRVYRDNIVIYDGEINALKRFKDDVKEVATGFECGMSIVNYNDVKVDDVFEAYSKEQIKA